MSTENNPTTSIGQAHLRKLAHFFLVIFQVITCLLACGCSSDVSEQGITLNGWERIEIPGVGSIEIPDSMEVQDDEYQDAKEAVTGTDSDTFIIQQAGLNEGSDEAMNTYARIMISCDQGSSDDYPPDEFAPGCLDDAEVSALDQAIEEAMRVRSPETGIQILDWHPLEFMEINGRPCMHIDYTRIGDEGETTQVDMYAFPCDDRLVNVTVSYRISDAAQWKSDLEEALNTLKIE